MFSKRFLFMLMYTPAACVLSLVRPYVGLTMLVAMYYFRPDIWNAPGWFRPVLYITMSVAVGWLLNMTRLRFTSIMGVAILVLLAMVASCVTSIHSETSVAATFLIFKMVLVMFLTLQLVDTLDKFNGFMWANILGMIWGVKTILILGLAGGNIDASVRVDVGVAQGGGANYLAMVLAMTLPFFHNCITSGEKRERLYGMVMSPIYVLCIVLTGSRGGFLSMGAAIGFVTLRGQKKLLGLVVAILTAVIFFIFVPQETLDRFTKGVSTDSEKRDFAAQSRIELWKAGWRMFSDYPILGVGNDNFQRLSIKYAGFAAGHGLTTKEGKRAGFVCHSTWFQTLAEGGALVSIPFFLLFVMVFWQMGKIKRMDLGPPKVRKRFVGHATTIQGLFLGFMVASTFGSHIKIDFMWWYFGLASALKVMADDQAATVRSRAAAEYRAKREASFKNAPTAA